MLRRLDPEGWSHRFQTGAILGFVTTLVAADLLAPFVVGSFFWALVPLAGALIWRFERTRLRDIVSWTVPLGVALFLAGLLPSPLGPVLTLLGLGALIAMMYSDRVRDAWLAFVAPGHYRRIRGPDRDVPHALWSFDQEAIRAIERFTHDRDGAGLADRVDRIATKAKALRIASATWSDLRDRFVAWLEFVGEAATGTSPDTAHAELERRHDAYDAAFAALIAKRSEPIGVPPRSAR